jgi:3-oxoacyl-(acyl-carrier-protein) synthase
MVYISGISLGLPNVLDTFSYENFDFIINGNHCLTKLNDRDRELVQKYTNKNVSHISRFEKEIDLKKIYDIKDKYLDTMTFLDKYGVAAGIEALKDFGYNPIENGNINYLSEEERDRIGVIYCSSCAFHDTAIDETEKRLNNEEYKATCNSIYKTCGSSSSLAMLFNLKGPNLQLNNKCSSFSTGIGLANDWLLLDKCDKVLVVGSDSFIVNNDLFLTGCSFINTGVVNNKETLEEVQVPFDKNRSGTILGSSAVGVLVTKEKYDKSYCKIIHSIYFNSGPYTILSLNVNELKFKMDKFLKEVELKLNETRETISKKLIYYAHETMTPSLKGCAQVENNFLEHCFKEHKKNIIITASKHLTGHSVGSSCEDVLAPYMLKNNKTIKLDIKTEDPNLGVINTNIDDIENRTYILRCSLGGGGFCSFIFLSKI